MKNSNLKKLEEQATVYITLSMMLSMSAQHITDYLGTPFLEYAMIFVAMGFLGLAVIKVNQYQKGKGKESCAS